MGPPQFLSPPLLHNVCHQVMPFCSGSTGVWFPIAKMSSIFLHHTSLEDASQRFHPSACLEVLKAAHSPREVARWG
jgi:hypothetical protein